MTQVKRIFASLICCIVLLSSCSTLLYGPSEKVTIKTGAVAVTAKLNGKQVDTGTDSVFVMKLSKRKKTALLEITKTGFHPVSFELNRSNHSAAQTWNTLGFVFGVGLTATGFGLASSGLESDNALSQSMLIPGLILTTSSIVDVVTKSTKTFVYRDLFFDMFPVTEIDKQNYESIICTAVNARIKPGDKVGNNYRQKGRTYRKIGETAWDETNNINYKDLTVNANDVLYTSGFNVPGLSNKFKEEDNARYQVKGEITRVQLDRYTKSMLAYMFLADVYFLIETRWSVFDNRKGEVVFEKTFTSSSWGKSTAVNTTVLKAVSGSMNKLIADEQFRQAVSRKTHTLPIAGQPVPETIALPVVKAPVKLTDIVESAVTIDLGNSHGSGFLVSADGYIITNYHVVQDESTVNVILNNGFSIMAQVIRTDKESDLALIKLPGKGFKPLSISGEEIQAGSDVVAVGTPGKVELGQSISKGIISGKREINGNIFLQTDVSISPGNSGGPLLNSKNQVVGIVNSKLVGSGIEGIGFAIPVQFALKKLGLTLKN